MVATPAALSFAPSNHPSRCATTKIVSSVVPGSDPQIVADIIVGALSGAIVNWRMDPTYSLPANLHDLGLALADLLAGAR